jgi:hypothetical protein
MGVLTVITFEKTNQIRGATSRSATLPALTGSLPGCRPDSQIW